MSSISSDDIEQASAECRYCETTLTDDDPTYRVLYGWFDHASEGTVFDKFVAGPRVDDRVMDWAEIDSDRVEGAQTYLEMIDRDRYGDEISRQIAELIEELDDLALQVELYRKHNLED